MRCAALALLMSCLPLTGCTRSNPAYCDGPADCPDPRLPACDPIIHTCVVAAPVDEPDGGQPDGPGDADGDAPPEGDGGDRADDPGLVTLWVDDDCDGSGIGSEADPYCSLDEAVQAATEGALVRVRAGDYPESLTLEKDISIEGDPGATLIAPACTAISIMGGARVSLRELWVRAEGSGQNGLIHASGSARLTGERLRLGPSACVGLQCSAASCELGGSLIQANEAGGLDLGQSSHAIRSCVVALNGDQGAVGGFGGVRISAATPGSSFAFNTVAFNHVQGGMIAGGVECVSQAAVDSCIVWGNDGQQVAASCSVTYSNVSQALGGGVGNQNTDPLFESEIESTLDLRLQPGSPSIDAGAPGATAIPDDPDGIARPQGGRADQGAFESH